MLKETPKEPLLLAVKLVKEISRERLGQPRPVSLVPNKRRKLLDKVRRQEERSQLAEQ